MGMMMSRRKFVFGSAVAFAGVSLASFTSCSSGATDVAEEAETTEEAVEYAPIRLAGLKGPTSMGMAKMLDDNDRGNTKNTYEFTMAPTGDELVPKILQGELDILAVPSNLGAVLYNSSEGGVQMLAANMLGAIYVLEKDGEAIGSIEDLKGQTVYTVGKGSTPQFLLAYLLEQHGLTMGEDVAVEWRDDPTEIVGLLSVGTASICMLPQPFVNVAQTQVENLRIALDMNAEWDALDNGSQLITAGLIARSEFVEEHPEQIADFLDELAASTDWINANVEDAAQLIEKYDIVPAAIAEAALPLCNIVCIVGKEMKTSTEAYFQVLYDQNPEAVGGAMPEDDFYYES